MAPSPTLFVFLLLVLQLIICNAAMRLPKFTALLIFGDSTVDSGNNNYLNTLAKGNHPPYGRDFPGHIATGRFSNGKLVPDMVASKLGIKDAIPPFLQPDLSDEELLTGVCFASGGSGLDDLTAAAAGVIPVSKQLSYLKMYVERLKRLVGEQEAQSIISGALVVISAGTNDFALNFYDLPTRKFQFNINEYQDFLLNNLQNFVQKVYNMGCRKMVVAGLPPIGCLPIQMTLKARVLQRTCLHHQNLDSKLYNQKLAEDLIPRWTRSLPGSLIIYADVYNPLSDMINHPQKYGFRETGRGCCGTGLAEVGPFCSPLSLVCHNTSLFLFWDGIHPTELAYSYLAQTILKQIIGSRSASTDHFSK
ncbi:GDSL esterase/lipase At2g30310-like [Diospyros lotus]|uniref:GDSL esterase/lipase At2g30310-like n=1 Tax=Diospyros lotus TaxID=55363 RepID=UPI00225B5E9F|nr:GDSL esterase/lipase At2g30310-like [Diospyros lotus]